MIDHTRFLPVPIERLQFLSQELYRVDVADLSRSERATVVQIALQEAMVDEQRRTNFFLLEAYEIYNARFR